MPKKVTKNGNTVYYYYKKKRGRKKKRGPKKKIIEFEKGKNYKHFDYKIVRCTNMKQELYIGKYNTLEEVNDAKKKLVEMNNKVKFKTNYKNLYKNKNQLTTFNGEYVILKRCKSEEDKVTRLRNEYGKYENYITTSKNWMIYDKFPYEKEETFWAYGYNNKNDRKEYNWIKENFIDIYLVTKYDSVMIYIFNNKIIFRYADKEFNFIICKNVSDAIKFYNILLNDYEGNKHVIFLGMTKKRSDRQIEIFNMIKEKTGWEDTKIYRRTTRK